MSIRSAIRDQSNSVDKAKNHIEGETITRMEIGMIEAKMIIDIDSNSLDLDMTSIIPLMRSRRPFFRIIPKLLSFPLMQESNKYQPT